MSRKIPAILWMAKLVLFLLLSLQSVPTLAGSMEDCDIMETLPPPRFMPRSGPLTVLPDDGREMYFRAIDAAQSEIRIEICVLEDPQILEHLQSALNRGVRVRVIVDRNKYGDISSERANLDQYLIAAGGELHLSNPVFPRSFPKIILIDSKMLVYGSACLDQTTFEHYRDFAHSSMDQDLLRELDRLFENDWEYSAAVGQESPYFNPTPPIWRSDLIISPVNAAERLVRFYQSAWQTLDVYTELLGNPTIQSELIAAIKRGVLVRLISPVEVNGATPEIQELQTKSLEALADAGVKVHVSGPNESASMPYMHARAAVVDGRIAYLGSISLSPNSISFNREMGLIVNDEALVQRLRNQFESDFSFKTKEF